MAGLGIWYKHTLIRRKFLDEQSMIMEETGCIFTSKKFTPRWAIGGDGAGGEQFSSFFQLKQAFFDPRLGIFF